MPLETFTNLPQTTVSSGGTTAPASGTSESWTVASSSSFPAASNSVTPQTQFHVADIAANNEIIAVTNVSGTTWTVTRGAEGTTPVAHTAGFTIYQVTTAGGLGAYPQWHNVRSPLYGAIGNGTTDDTTAVQAAVTAAKADGGTVYFPAGTYLISSPLLVGGGSPGAIRVIGEGWNSQVKLKNAANCYLFDFGSSGSPQYTPGLVMRDLYLNCNAANQTGASGGVYARGAVNCLFDHLWVEAPYEYGIHFYQDGTGTFGHHNRITNCLFMDGYLSGSYGIAVKFEQADENTVAGCTFQDNGTSTFPSCQVYDTSAGRQTITHCAFVTTHATAVTMFKTDSSPSACVLSGCVFDSSTTGNLLELNGPSCAVVNCTFLSFGTANRAVNLNSYTVVTGCTFTPSGSSGYAIHEGGGSNWNTIGNNTYTGSYGTGGPVVLTGANSSNTLAAATDWINAALAFGADPTGAADSTTAIQNALNAIPSAGGVVYLPAGTYKVSSTLSVPYSPASVAIVGDGRSATVISAATPFTGTPIIQFTASGSGFRLNPAIRDLTINTAASGRYGIQLDSTYFASVQRVNIEGVYAKNIYLNGSSSYFGAYTNIEECHLGAVNGGAGSGGTGIESNNHEHWNVTNCTIDWFNVGGGIGIKCTSSDCMVSDCHFDANDTAIDLYFCAQMMIHGNSFDRGYTQFLKLQGCTGCQITDNSFNSFSGAGSQYMIVPTSDGGRAGNRITGNQVITGTSWHGFVNEAGGSDTDPDIYAGNNIDSAAVVTRTTSIWRDNSGYQSAIGSASINAVAYGADPSGTADSTTAIQNAISALPSAGGTVYLPAGTYKITSTLTMTANQAMVGAGVGATVITSSTDTVLIRMGNRQVDSTMRNWMRLADMTVNQTNGTMTHANVKIDGGGRGTSIQRVSTGGGAYGFELMDLDRCDFTDLSANNPATAGIWLEVGLENTYGTVTFINCDAVLSNNSTYGFLVAKNAGQSSPNQPDRLAFIGCMMYMSGGLTGCVGFYDTIGLTSANFIGCLWEQNNRQFRTDGSGSSVNFLGSTFLDSHNVCTDIAYLNGSGTFTFRDCRFQQATNVFNGVSGNPSVCLEGKSNNQGNLTNIFTGSFTSKMGTDTVFAGSGILAVGLNATPMSYLFCQNTQYSLLESNLTGGGNISQGSGAPSKPFGVNPVAGDIWFRTDTPSTANQRIYICTTGGGSPVWSGIV